MAELQEVVASLGHTEVVTYIQSGNVLFTPRPAGSATAARTDTAALAAELERAIAERAGVRARAVVLSGEDLARCVRDNPYPGETNPRLLHAVFLPEAPGPDLGPGGRNGAQLGDGQQAGRALRTLTSRAHSQLGDGQARRAVDGWLSSGEVRTGRGPCPDSHPRIAAPCPPGTTLPICRTCAAPGQVPRDGRERAGRRRCRD